VSKEFSQRVKQAISEKNVSRRAASTYAGLRVNAISTIINHPEQTPETETVRKLASYFVESQDEWLELAGHRTKEQPPPAGLSALRWHYTRMSPLHRESLLAIADTFTALEAKGVAETNDTSVAEEPAEYTTEDAAADADHSKIELDPFREHVIMEIFEKLYDRADKLGQLEMLRQLIEDTDDDVFEFAVKAYNEIIDRRNNSQNVA